MIDLGRTRTVSGDITGALGQGPDIDGDRILYYGFPRGSGSNYGLYLIDLQQGTEVALTPGGYEPNMREPLISGKTVIWSSYRKDGAGVATSVRGIFACSLANCAAAQLEVSGFSTNQQANPKIDGNRVVWLVTDGGNPATYHVRMWELR